SLYIDRSASADDSKLNVESLIKNLKNVIMKKLSVSCVAESLTFLSVLSVSFSVTLSQSSISVSVSGSPAPATSVPATLTSITSDFTVSAFMTSSLHFKKMLYRLNESHLSVELLSLLNSVEIAKDIHVFRNRNMNVILFYTYKHETLSEIILIKDNNTTETTFSHSQASLITFSLFSAEKVMHTL
ncbi:hypothetical protein BDDG_12480, partial [Blastomyces dermatitidis ATCC 18188]